MEIVAITGNPRTDISKKATKAIRKEAQVPCVIYGGEENVHFSAVTKTFKPLVYSPDFKLAEITVDGKAYKCILKDMQFHPVTDELLHMDFIELIPNKKVKVELPIKFKGVSPGVKAGGKLMPKLRRAKVFATPESLVEDLSVDISELALGSSVRVKDIELPEGIELINGPSIPVASVEIPRALRSAEDAAAKEGDGADEAAEPAAE